MWKEWNRIHEWCEPPTVRRVHKHNCRIHYPRWLLRPRFSRVTRVCYSSLHNETRSITSAPIIHAVLKKRNQMFYACYLPCRQRGEKTVLLLQTCKKIIIIIIIIIIINNNNKIKINNRKERKYCCFKTNMFRTNETNPKEVEPSIFTWPIVREIITFRRSCLLELSLGATPSHAISCLPACLLEVL